MLVGFALACTDRPGASGDGSGDVGGTMVMAAPGSGSMPLLPPYSGDALSRLVTDNVFERLAEISPELNTRGDAGFTPRLAESWTWASDSLSVAFTLNPRARWHDGRPVTANDVRFTLQLLKDPRTATTYTAALANVDSVSVRDSLTAVVWYKRRTPEQFYDFVYQAPIMPEHLVKDIPRDKLSSSPFANHPVGSGRFRFAAFEPGVRIELLADTAHYRGRPKLDRVILVFTGDVNNAITQLFSGQADFLEILPADVLPRVDSGGNIRALPYGGLAYSFMGMNPRDPRRPAQPHPVFGDRTVRLAITQALDREGMLRNVFSGRGILTTGPYPRALSDTGVKAPAFDKARAAALLDSAGWRAGADGIRVRNGRPLEFGLIVPSSSRPRMRYAVLIQEQLKDVGVKVNIESMDFNAFSERQDRGAFDAAMMSQGTDPTPATTSQNWGTSGIPPRGQNFARYSNPKVDALLDSSARNFDPARGREQFRRAAQQIVDDVPAVWLYDVLTIAGVHKRIRTVGLRADGWWAGLAEWSIPEGERIDRDRIGLRPAQP
jgi:peptide/nickel transport system substrate-binding protein